MKSGIIVVISNGKITADERTEDISTVTADAKKLSVTVEGSSSTVLSVLGDVDGVTKVRRNMQEKDNVYQYHVEYKKTADIRRGVFRALAKADCPILNMQDAGMSLEEAYLQLTSSTRVETKKKKKGEKN